MSATAFFIDKQDAINFANVYRYEKGPYVTVWESTDIYSIHMKKDKPVYIIMVLEKSPRGLQAYINGLTKRGHIYHDVEVV